MSDMVVAGCGIVCSVGLNAPAACAAIRCGLTNPVETRFMNSHGQWIMAAEVPLDTPWRGHAKLAHMAAMAVKEAVFGLSEEEIQATPLLLCLAEPDRPGRIADQDKLLLHEIQNICRLKFHSQSRVIANGRVSGIQTIEKAHPLLASGEFRHCVIVGVDTYLTAGTLEAYDVEKRILTEENSNGFTPGEAGAAVLLTLAGTAPNASIAIKGFGFGKEKAHLQSGEPLKADGMVQAVKNALSMAGRDLSDLDYRICDISGEQYYFKEVSLTLTRILRNRKEEFDIWHPAECIGETGSAIALVVLALASAAVTKGYSKGDAILCHFANDDGQRAAIVVL